MNRPEIAFDGMLLPKSKAREWYAVQQENFAAQNRGVMGQCLFRWGECNATPIKSHLLSRSWLQRIADSSNHVLEIALSTGQMTSKPARFEPKRIGINEATTFPGFCSEHDVGLFHCVENQDFSSTPAQILALAYRSIAHQVCRKQQMAKCNLPRLTSHDQHPAMRWAVEDFRRLLLLVGQKLRLEESIVGEANCLDTYAIFFLERPTISTATTFLPTITFTGRVLDRARHDWLTLTVFPLASGGCALFSWQRNAAKNASLLVKSLAALPSQSVTQALLNLVFEVSEDFVMSPDWWARLQEAKQNELMRRFVRASAENRPPSPEVFIPSKDNGHNWGVARREFIR